MARDSNVLQNELKISKHFMIKALGIISVLFFVI